MQKFKKLINDKKGFSSYILVFFLIPAIIMVSILFYSISTIHTLYNSAFDTVNRASDIVVDATSEQNSLRDIDRTLNTIPAETKFYNNLQAAGLTGAGSEWACADKYEIDNLSVTVVGEVITIEGDISVSVPFRPFGIEIPKFPIPFMAQSHMLYKNY